MIPNPLKFAGSLLKIFVAVLILGGFIYLFMNYNVSFMQFVQDIIQPPEAKVEVSSFQTEKIKDFYDIILTNETLENLQGSVPAIKDISCEEEECNFTIAYNDGKNNFEEVLTMFGEDVIESDKGYIISVPERTIYTGKTDIIETTNKVEKNIENGILEFSIEREVNCAFEIETATYSTFPDGNIYVVIYGNSLKPKNCITTKFYLITIPLPNEYHVKQIYITSPGNSKLY
ncbi:hypothetical protein KO465_03910 [Candidatus Micrarchaeota archaeon]|nr:hypothetical protein [Candidatus Micrarchaeota archaeon]